MGAGGLGGVGFHGPCSLFLPCSSPSVSDLLEMRVESESCPPPGPPRPSPASPSHGYGSWFKGTGFLLHLLPGAPSQFGTRVRCGRSATRPNRHTDPYSICFFLKNISHLCFEATHGLPAFGASPDPQKVRNWILCSWTSLLEDVSRAAVLLREGSPVDNAGSVGGFCSVYLGR